MTVAFTWQADYFPLKLKVLYSWKWQRLLREAVVVNWIDDPQIRVFENRCCTGLSMLCKCEENWITK